METNFNKVQLAAINFARSVGMNISLESVPNKKVLMDNGKEHQIRENDGAITYVGGLDLEFICHEIGHFQVASIDRRHLPDYGMYGIPVKKLSDLITESQELQRTGCKQPIIPECIEDGRASLLGDLHKSTFAPNYNGCIFGPKGMTSCIPCWMQDDAVNWLTKHRFIVDGKPTNKLNTMSVFETFADYF